MRGTVIVKVGEARDLPLKQIEQQHVNHGEGVKKKKNKKRSHSPKPHRGSTDSNASGSTDDGHAPHAPPATTTLGLKPHTYVSVSLGQSEQTTSVVPDSASPAYDANFEFPDVNLNVDMDEIVCTVYDRPSSGPPEIIGTSTLKASRVINGAESSLSSHTLISPDGTECGELIWSCRWGEVPPEQTTSEDFIDSGVVQLQGPRPSLLRAEFYYGGVKGLYSMAIGLPVISMFVPMVEGAVEGVLSKTSLKASPEDGDIKATYNLDKAISKMLVHADDVVDKKKDEALQGIRGLKNAVKGFSPKDTVGAAIGGIHEIIDNILGKVHESSASVTSATGSAISATTDSISSAASGVKTAVTDVAGAAVDTVKRKASQAGELTAPSFNNVTSTVSDVANGVGETVSTIITSATSYATSLLSPGKDDDGVVPDEHVQNGNGSPVENELFLDSLDA